MSGTGLIAVFSDAFVSIANPVSFGVLALLSAGLVNFFVPSGGGQFAVQGPIMLDAANQLGVDPSIAIMAVSTGTSGRTCSSRSGRCRCSRSRG